jgi:CheY-like chemotaxis protein
MNGILGMAELTLDTELNRTQREYLTMLKESANSLLTIINDILDFSKIEAGKVELESIPFSLRVCVGDALKTLAIRAGQKNLELISRIVPAVPDALIGDPTRLRQVILNLTGNAIKFTHQGEIVVQVEMESSETDGNLFHFSVKDTGIGIPLEKQKTIFDPFTQADGSTSRQYGGTGLGLTISSKLVEQMGGKIWIESAPGQGSTFHFTAKFELSSTPIANGVPVEPDSIHEMPVLVVDDNATNRRILEEVLLNWKMKPTAVSSAQEALVELKRASSQGILYRLIILDAMMPQMDGFQLAEELKSRAELGESTIMMLSSGFHAADLRRCEDLGIDSFLSKPVTQSDLLDAILTAMGKKKAPQTPKDDSKALPAAAQSLNILLVEDNAVNRAVAAGILEKRGHRITHAPDGQTALKEHEKGPFDVILMDIQMPDMDGIQVTAHIRQREAPKRQHTPIVAMTAHAMKGDRENYLASGMDDYISKPINKNTLIHIVERFANPSSASSPATVSEPHSNLTGLLKELDGDRDLLQNLIQLFIETTPQMLLDIQTAITQNDATALSRAAHKFKSSLGPFGADSALKLTKTLEEKGKQNDLQGAPELFASLQKEVDQLFQELPKLTV